MSAGRFTIATYETNSAELPGQFMPIQVQPETLQLFVGGVANAGSTTARNLNLRVNVSGNNRSLGVKPRTVTVRFTDPGDLPDGYSGDDLTLPVLTVAASSAYTTGATGTYLGSPVTVVGSGPERVR